MDATTETIQGKERDMIDTQVQNRLTFESVQGTLVKSNTESKFTMFQIDSGYAKGLFDHNYDYKDIIPLQFMLCGNDWILMEYLEKGAKHEID